MRVSCGFILDFDGEWLLCHPTNGPYDRWDFPKGIAEPHESNLDAAIRELMEETGYDLDPQYYIQSLDLGEKKYTSAKNMNLFYVNVREPICCDFLRCESFVTEVPGVDPFPEVDKFQLVNPSEAYKLLGKTMKTYVSSCPHLVDLICSVAPKRKVL